MINIDYIHYSPLYTVDIEFMLWIDLLLCLLAQKLVRENNTHGHAIDKFYDRITSCIHRELQMPVGCIVNNRHSYVSG